MLSRGCLRDVVRYLTRSGTPLRGSSRSGEGFAELAAQGHDRDADNVRERVDILIPRLLEELLGGHHGASAAQEFFQDEELLVPQ